MKCTLQIFWITRGNARAVDNPDEIQIWQWQIQLRFLEEIDEIVTLGWNGLRRLGDVRFQDLLQRSDET